LLESTPDSGTGPENGERKGNLLVPLEQKRVRAAKKSQGLVLAPWRKVMPGGEEGQAGGGQARTDPSGKKTGNLPQPIWGRGGGQLRPLPHAGNKWSTAVWRGGGTSDVYLVKRTTFLSSAGTEARHPFCRSSGAIEERLGWKGTLSEKSRQASSGPPKPYLNVRA